jgi:hypothetical protein
MEKVYSTLCTYLSTTSVGNIFHFDKYLVSYVRDVHRNVNTSAGSVRYYCLILGETEMCRLSL